MKDPVEHAALYQELIDVTTEIKSLEPVLLSPDAPVITANSAAGTVFTKTKVGRDGSRYLFAYNYTAAPVTAEFTLAQPAASILDYDTGATCAPDTSTTFSGGSSRTRRMSFSSAIPLRRHRRFRARRRRRARHRDAAPQPPPRPPVATTTPTATDTRDSRPQRDADCDQRPRRPTASATPDCHGHARCIVGLAGEVEIRCSESRHHQSRQDFESDQRGRGGSELSPGCR